MASWLWGVSSESKFFIVRRNGKSFDDDGKTFVKKNVIFNR